MNILINKKVECISIGSIGYQEGWDYQTTLFEKTVDIKLQNRNLPAESQKPTPNYLIFCEHPHVYTLGKSGKAENLLLDEKALKKNGAEFFKINRGGDITYHGPGQIVGYPVIDLENFFTDIHKYLRFLEETIIRTLMRFGINSSRLDGLTGVWVDTETTNPRKICAMGVKTSRWVTMHGFALNVNTDLSYFSNIIPCGIDDKQVTSMEKELNKTVNIDKVAEALKEEFINIFDMSPYN